MHAAMARKCWVVEIADQLARVALPDGEDRGHADAGKIFLAVGAEVFKENVSKGDLSNALIIEEAERFFHARFVNRIDTLRGNEDFVKRQAE